ncbi:MAG: phosphodiesterase [Kiritimatiellae bacterium]|nr:phosphodiesterase [Kiritimatiellia bacterium]
MRLLFFSDVHGVPERLKQLWKQADALCPDRLILLGDALYHGPRNGVPFQYDTTETAALLNARKESILAVRGNCDAEVDQMMLEFPILSDSAGLYADGIYLFLTHGHLFHEYRLPPLQPGDVLVHGHTHIPELKRLPGGIILFNPGSISLPKGGNIPTFGFYENHILSIRALSDSTVLREMEIRETPNEFQEI